MKVYNEPITIQSKKPREVFNLTTQVKAAWEKSGFREGMILVSSLHLNSAVIVNDGEAHFLEELENWLLEVAPVRDDYRHSSQLQPNSAYHFQSLSLHHQVVVGFSEGRLDLGSEQSVLYIELDGLRPKRILVKVMGA